MHLFLTLEAGGVALAALVHAGVIAGGSQHREAALTESAIAAVLALGLVATVAVPESSRDIRLGVQAFALLGTLVGVFAIAVGVGPDPSPTSCCTPGSSPS